MRDQKEVNREYKERKIPAGVFQIRNSANGKVLLVSSLNLEGKINRHRFQLTNGMHPNPTLQAEWKKFGADRFLFEVLEVVKVKDDPEFNIEDELTLLEQIWLEKIVPFGERGYNASPSIRQ